MISICCAIVLYKMQLSESPAFQSAYAQIGTHHKIRLFIFDNSPDADSNHRNYPDIRYDHCPDNKGLGYAYNAAARYASKEKLDWLLLLDQDTILPDGFFDSYIDAISAHPDLQLFVPQVFLPKGTEFSPFRRWKAQKNPLSPGRIYPIKHYLLINSGLCVKLSLFERSGGYDERIWLDLADTQFVRKLWHSGERYFYLLPCKCFQNFSNEQTDIEKLQSRFEIYLECGKNCKFLDFPDWAFRQYCVISHTLSLTIRTRKISFLTKSITKYWMRR